MSLKKKLVVGGISTTWLVSSGLTFIALTEDDPKRRGSFDNTVSKRVALVTAGPIVWVVGGAVALYDKYLEGLGEELQERVKNFMTDPPKKS
jgi:hypothetical protein